MSTENWEVEAMKALEKARWDKCGKKETPGILSRDEGAAIIAAKAPKVDVDTEKRYAAVLGMLAGIRKNYARTRPILVSRVRDIARSALWPEYRHSKGRCDECGLPYDLFPCDMNIQDHLWEKINDKAPGGYLCPTCICKRLVVICNLTVVSAMIDISDPFKKAITAHLDGGDKKVVISDEQVDQYFKRVVQNHMDDREDGNEDSDHD